MGVAHYLCVGVEGSGGNVLDEVNQYIAKCSVLVVPIVYCVYD